jgi:hypothetical protein
MIISLIMRHATRIRTNRELHLNVPYHSTDYVTPQPRENTPLYVLVGSEERGYRDNHNHCRHTAGSGGTALRIPNLGTGGKRAQTRALASLHPDIH